MEDIRFRYKRTDEFNVYIPRSLGEDMFRYIDAWTNKISGITVGAWTRTKNTLGSYRVVAIRRIS